MFSAELLAVTVLWRQENVAHINDYLKIDLQTLCYLQKYWMNDLEINVF